MQARDTLLLAKGKVNFVQYRTFNRRSAGVLFQRLLGNGLMQIKSTAPFQPLVISEEVFFFFNGVMYYCTDFSLMQYSSNSFAVPIFYFFDLCLLLLQNTVFTTFFHLTLLSPPFFSSSTVYYTIHYAAFCKAFRQG